MNDIDPKIVLQDLFNAIKSHGELNQYMDTDVDGNHFIALDGNIYNYDINIDITERPYVASRRPAVYYPVDQASPEETEIGGNFDFDIISIKCYDNDGDEYDISSMLTPKILEQIKQALNFNTDEFIEDDNELFESIKLSERDFATIVKKIINEVASKRTAINRIYKVTQKITGGIYRDDNWQGVRMVVDAIKSLGYQIGLGAKDGGYRKSSDGMSQWKEYQVDIDTPEGFNIQGTLNCHAAGSVEDPFDRYDMSLVLW